MRNSFLFLLVVCTLLTACSPSSSTAQLPQEIVPDEDGFAGVRLPDPLPRPRTTLVDTNGVPFDLSATESDRTVLVFMGYTSCPDICPVHMAAIARAAEATGLVPGRDFDVVFISVDPERDDLDTLRRFLDAFDSRFIGATGTAEQINDTADALGLAHPVFEEPSESGFYTVGHPGEVIVFGPDGPARIVYPFGVRTSHWVADLPRIVAGEVQ